MLSLRLSESIDMFAFAVTGRPLLGVELDGDVVAIASGDSDGVFHETYSLISNSSRPKFATTPLMMLAEFFHSRG